MKTISKLTTAAVKETLGMNLVSKKNGVFTARQGFFYTGGKTSERYVEKVKAAYPEAVIIDHGEVWLPFRGGAPVGKQSHWFVKFMLPE